MDATDAAEPGGGGKRKYKENALTAKAESGTLRVKILRKEQAPAAAKRVRDSPPKPRANRKHVPIFYQQRARALDASDAVAAAALSLSQASTTSAASTDAGAGTSAADLGPSASTSSTGSAYAALLSGLQLDSGSGGASPPPAAPSIADLLPPAPAANPLFSRSDSDGLGALSDLLRPHFPSASGPSFALPGAVSTGLLGPHMLLSAPSAPVSTSDSASVALAPPEPSSAAAESTTALHQLAASSQHYRSALDALSAATIQSAARDRAEESARAAAAAGGADASPRQYKFNPLSALQSAIDHAQQLSQTLASQAAPAEDAGIQRLLDDASDEDAGSPADGELLGPPPIAPPALRVENSLMGGGIEALAARRGGGKAASPPPDAASADTETDLGPPPAAPPTIRIENSLMGGGIETQPLIANVNTRSFDWKFRTAAGKLVSTGAGCGGLKAPAGTAEGGAARADGEDEAGATERRGADAGL